MFQGEEGFSCAHASARSFSFLFPCSHASARCTSRFWGRPSCCAPLIRVYLVPCSLSINLQMSHLKTEGWNVRIMLELGMHDDDTVSNLGKSFVDVHSATSTGLEAFRFFRTLNLTALFWPCLIPGTHARSEHVLTLAPWPSTAREMKHFVSK